MFAEKERRCCCFWEFLCGDKSKTKDRLGERQIELMRVNLNGGPHFRGRIEIRTRFETLRSDVDFVRRTSNVIVADAIVSVGVNVTQTDLKKTFLSDRSATRKARRTCLPRVKP